MTIRGIILSAVTMLCASAAWAQTVPPALMVREGDRSAPLKLSKLTVEARIVGHLAQTRMTMTFANPNDRPLAGDLYFPLPEGATVSGYALDIDGAMVDGVVVEKDRGRQVFESIVRQGIDPGLVEWAKGNNFKTRVFPIPARGTRTVRVDYVSDLVEADRAASFLLPLNFKDKLDELTLRVQVVRPGGEPKIAQAGGLANFKFDRWQDGFAAETTLKGAALEGNLVIALPAVDKQPVRVEKAPDGQFYFCIDDYPAPPAQAQPATPALPGRVTILWDASGSRGGAERQRELALLKLYFAQFSRPVHVELVLFRDAPAPARSFKIAGGDASALLAELGKVAYDGGTQMAAVSPSGAAPPDLYLLFTDGLSNFGKEEPTGLTRPVHVLSADPTANHAFLRFLAIQTGGTYFNLSKLDDATVLAGLTAKAPFSFLSADADNLQAAGVYPRLAQAVHGRFTLAGRLLADEATVTLHYGRPGQPPQTSNRFTVRKADAVEGDLLRRHWAGQKLAELMIFTERNEEDIVTLGKQYGLVTPFTSLIVLDNLEQYLQHGIAPPASLPQLRRQYDEQIAARKADQEKGRRDKLEQVVAMWNERVKWWETEYKYPKDFKYKDPDKGKDLAMGVAQGAARPRADAPSEPARTGEAPPATPQPLLRPADPAGAAEARPSNDLGVAGQGGGATAGKNGRGDGESAVQPGVVIKPWDPKTPYMAKLKAAPADQRETAYLAQRAENAKSPAFFLDVADWLFKQRETALAVRVLSNIAELELENAALLRVLAHKLAQEGQLDLAIATFEQVRKLRPEEPQSHRDLALALARRAGSLMGNVADSGTGKGVEGWTAQAASDYRRAIELLYHVVLNTWDRFEQIELIALMELNAILPRAKAAGVADVPVDPRLVKLLDLDVRIVMTWDADLTDMDLHVVEPSGERAFYGHNRTTIGGLVSRDFTQGYGPEEYLLRKAMGGTYKVKTNFFGSNAQTVLGAVTLQVEVITHFGRPTERRKSVTIRLSERKETLDVAEMEF